MGQATCSRLREVTRDVCRASSWACKGRVIAEPRHKPARQRPLGRHFLLGRDKTPQPSDGALLWGDKRPSGICVSWDSCSTDALASELGCNSTSTHRQQSAPCSPATLPCARSLVPKQWTQQSHAARPPPWPTHASCTRAGAGCSSKPPLAHPSIVRPCPSRVLLMPPLLMPPPTDCAHVHQLQLWAHFLGLRHTHVARDPARPCGIVDRD